MLDCDRFFYEQNPDTWAAFLDWVSRFLGAVSSSSNLSSGSRRTRSYDVQIRGRLAHPAVYRALLDEENIPEASQRQENDEVEIYLKHHLRQKLSHRGNPLSRVNHTANIFTTA